MLRLDRAGLDAICAQARREHPAECCGILTAPAGSDLSSVHPCRNIQAQLHACESERYPRDARAAYFIDPGEQHRVIASAERDGGRVTGFYHSHVDRDAYFSDEDRERAVIWDEPAYPEAVHLVVSVHGDGVRGYRAFQWVPACRRYAEVGVEVAQRGEHAGPRR